MWLDDVNTGLGQIVKFFGACSVGLPVAVGVILGAALFDSAKIFWIKEALFGALFSDFAEFVECIDLTLDTFGLSFESNDLSFECFNQSVVLT